MHLAAIVCWTLLVLAGAIVPGHAEKRVALVVGNGAYQHADKLANPVTDARAMRDTLGRLGFEVVYGENLGKQELELKIGSFADAVHDADVALVYFAGHGATFGDVPYVVPVDAQFSSLGQMPYVLVAVETLIGELRQAKGLRIAILDACRDDAAEHDLKRVAARGGEVTRGLARVKNPEGLILAYATQNLSTAADGDADGDSPFTTALLHNIATPGLDVKELFYRVGREVISTTKGQQRPEISISFYDSYALVPGNAPGSPTSSTAVAPVADAAAQAWASVKDTTSIAMLERFRALYPGSVYVPFAAARIEELKKPQVAVVAPPPVAPAEAPRPAPIVPAVVAPPATAPPAAPGPCGGGAQTVSLSTRCATPLSAAEERSLKPKDSFKECDKCPEMVVVPAGSFTMGSPASERDFDNEGPQHAVTIGKPLAVGRFTVTFDEWDACVADGGCQGYKPSDAGWGRARRPVINVSWDNAQVYLKWISGKTSKTYRLLSEAEWEYAARGGMSSIYPWGNVVGKNNANCPGCGSRWDEKSTAPVGSFKANGFGLYDMVGNVSQLTQDCYHKSYQGAPSNGSPWTSGDCKQRVLRGNSWVDLPGEPRAANRSGDTPVFRNDAAGFRVAMTLN